MKKPETLHLLPVRAESAAPALLRGKSSTSAPYSSSSARSTGKRPALSPGAQPPCVPRPVR